MLLGLQQFHLGNRVGIEALGVLEVRFWHDIVARAGGFEGRQVVTAGAVVEALTKRVMLAVDLLLGFHAESAAVLKLDGFAIATDLTVAHMVGTLFAEHVAILPA